MTVFLKNFYDSVYHCQMALYVSCSNPSILNMLYCLHSMSKADIPCRVTMKGQCGELGMRVFNKQLVALIKVQALLTVSSVCNTSAGSTFEFRHCFLPCKTDVGH